MNEENFGAGMALGGGVVIACVLLGLLLCGFVDNRDAKWALCKRAYATATAADSLHLRAAPYNCPEVSR